MNIQPSVGDLVIVYNRFSSIAREPTVAAMIGHPLAQLGYNIDYGIYLGNLGISEDARLEERSEAHVIMSIADGQPSVRLIRHFNVLVVREAYGAYRL
jgi:hypothetical protein